MRLPESFIANLIAIGKYFISNLLLMIEHNLTPLYF